MNKKSHRKKIKKEKKDRELEKKCEPVLILFHILHIPYVELVIEFQTLQNKKEQYSAYQHT